MMQVYAFGGMQASTMQIPEDVSLDQSISVDESVEARLKDLGKLVCNMQHSVKAHILGAWSPSVVVLFVALAPGAFLVSLILAVQRFGAQGKASSEKDALSIEKAAASHSSGGETEYLHPMAAGALIAAWNTTSTMINFPFIFGVLGSLGGIFFTLLIQGAGCLVTLHMVDLTTHFNAGRRKEDRVVDFPGLGKCLGGQVWQKVFAFIQMLNQLGFLPYALTLMVSSLQALFPQVEFLQCNMTTCLIVVAFGYAIVQLSRDWKDAEEMSYITLVLLVIMAFILVHFAYAHDFHYGGPTPLVVGGEYQLFPNCTGTCMPEDKQYGLLNIIDAIGSIMFSFAPCFIIVEMMGEMERPETDAKTATNVAFAFSSVLYCGIGLVFAMLWGNQIPEGVHSLLPKGSWQSIYINLVVIFAMVLDLFIGIIVVNRYLMARFHPEFDYKWTTENAWVWARITFAPATIMFVMTLFIPNLVAVIGFVDCFCVPWAQYIFPVMFTVLPVLRTYLNRSTDAKDEENGSNVELPPISSFLYWVFAGSCLFGILWSGFEFYKFVHGLADLDFGTGYFCNQVASLG